MSFMFFMVQNRSILGSGRREGMDDLAGLDYRSLQAAVNARHSVRSFAPRPLEPEDFEAVARVCRLELPMAAGARVVLVQGAKGVFNQLIIKEPPAFLAMTVRRGAGPESAGYLGEIAILAATSRGLGSCWVSGTVNREAAHRLASLAADEELLAVSPIGYPASPRLIEQAMKKLARSAARKPIEQLLTAASLPWDACPEWARNALRSARLAPSAVNRQPWRFTVELGRIAVETAVPGSAARLDCGIALAHVELGALAAGVRGTWRPASAPSEVAVYVLA
jgi:nitroreductase